MNRQERRDFNRNFKTRNRKTNAPKVPWVVRKARLNRPAGPDLPERKKWS